MSDQAPATDAPPPLWQRHDLIVVAAAAALLIAGSLAYRVLTRPTMVEFTHGALRFERPTGFFPPRDVEPPASPLSGLGRLAPAAAEAAATSFHQIYKTPAGPLTALEVLIDRRPEYQGLAIVLQQARKLRYGEYVWTAESGERELHGRRWLRTEFQYAVKATADDAPQVATGIEYATLNGDHLYVVTVHGTEADARRLESLVLSTLELNQGK